MGRRLICVFVSVVLMAVNVETSAFAMQNGEIVTNETALEERTEDSEETSEIQQSMQETADGTKNRQEETATEEASSEETAETESSDAETETAENETVTTETAKTDSEETGIAENEVASEKETQTEVASEEETQTEEAQTRQEKDVTDASQTTGEGTVLMPDVYNDHGYNNFMQLKAETKQMSAYDDEVDFSVKLTEEVSIKYAVTGESTVKVMEINFIKLDDDYIAVEIPETVTDGGKTYTVTELGYCMSMIRFSVECIILPDTIEYIHPMAFCLFDENLEEVRVSETNPYFSVGENGVLYNKDKTAFIWAPLQKGFDTDGNRKYITVTEPVSTFNSLEVYRHGDGLRFLDTSNLVYDNGAYYAEDKTKLIGVDRSFSGEFTIPDNVIEIAESAFTGCKQISKVTIPNSVTKIGEASFYCSTIQEVIFEENTRLTYIAPHAFELACLQSITIPKSIQEIGAYAFYVNFLTTVTFEEGSQLEIIRQDAFGGGYFSEISIPASVKRIEHNAFDSVLNIIFPEDSQVEVLEDDFSCYMESAMFVVPASIKEIGISSLKKVWFTTKEPPKITSRLSAIDIYFPKSAEAAYREAIAAYDEYISEHEKYLHPYDDSDISEDAFTIFKDGIYTCQVMEEGTVCITAAGDFEVTTLTIPSVVTNAETCKRYTVTKIGDRAFGVDPTYTYLYYEYEPEKHMNILKIPSTVTEIGYKAFVFSHNLTKVEFEEGSQLQIIGEAAFWHCEKLYEVTIPDSVTEIRSTAFADCGQLTYVNISENSRLEKIGTWAFANVPSSMYLTNGAPPIEHIYIPKTLKYIGKTAFANTKEFTLPFTFEEMEQIVGINPALSGEGPDYGVYLNSAFNTWLNTETFHLPDQATCDKLKEIDTQDKANKPDDYYSGITYTTEPYVPKERECVSDDGYLYHYDASLQGIVITDHLGSMLHRKYEVPVTIPSALSVDGISYPVIKVGERAMAQIFILEREIEGIIPEGCRANKETKLIIPASVKDIDKNAFAKNPFLYEVTFATGSQVTDIAAGAFSETAITKISIPESVTKMGYAVFYKTDTLKQITFEGTTPPEFATSESYPQLIPSSVTHVIVPKGMVATYQTALNGLYDATATSIVDEAPEEEPIPSQSKYERIEAVMTSDVSNQIKAGDSFEKLRDYLIVTLHAKEHYNTHKITDYMIASGIFAEGDNTIEITWIDKDADNYLFKTSVTLYVTSSSETFEALKAEWRTQIRPEYKIGQLYEVIRNDLSVSVYDGETNTYRPIQNFTIQEGTFAEGTNIIVISYYDTVCACLLECRVEATGVRESGLSISGIRCSTGVALSEMINSFSVPAGLVVTKDMIFVNAYGYNSEGAYREVEVTDYTIRNAALKKGANTLEISYIHDDGKEYTATLQLNAYVRATELRISIKEGQQFKEGDIPRREQFDAVCVFAGENNYRIEETIVNFDILTTQPLQAGENKLEFLYVDVNSLGGSVTLTKTLTVTIGAVGEIEEDCPSLSDSVLTADKYKDPAYVDFYVWPARNTSLTIGEAGAQSQKLYQTNDGSDTIQEGITYTVDGQNGCALAVAASVKKGTYSLYLKAYVNETKHTYYLPMVITVTEKLPKLTASATAINLYDVVNGLTSKVTLKNIGSCTIASAELGSTTKMADYFTVSVDDKQQSVTLRLSDNTVPKKKIVSKGTLLLKLTEYAKIIEVPVKISVTEKKPQLRVTPANVVLNTYLLPDQRTVSIAVEQKNGSGYEALDLSDAELNLISSPELFEAWMIQGSRILLTMRNQSDFAKQKTIKMQIKAKGWPTAQTISCKIKVENTLPKAVLQSKTLKLDKRAEGAQTSTYLTFNALPGEIFYQVPAELTARKNSEKAPKVILEKIDAVTYKVTASHGGSAMAAGTYQYDFTPVLSDTTPLKKVTLTVKVADSKKPVSASFKAQKGSSIDLSRRMDTAYTWNVTANAVNTQIADVTLKKIMLGDKAVDLSSFLLTKQLDESGNVSGVTLAASFNADLTAGKSYQLYFEVTPKTAGQTLASSEVCVTVKPKESTPKFTVNRKSAVINMVSNTSVRYLFRPSQDGVKIAESTNVSTNIPEGAFLVTENAKGDYTIRLIDSTKVKKNKTYTFKFKVRVEGGTRTVTQSISIKVK